MIRYPWPDDEPEYFKKEDRIIWKGVLICIPIFAIISYLATR